MRQNGVFQGSIPPNFISFSLENQTPERETMPDTSAASPPVTADIAVFDPPPSTVLLYSPGSADSEPDFNAFAEAKVRSMEAERL